MRPLATPGIAETIVVSPDREALARPLELGARTLRQREPGPEPWPARGARRGDRRGRRRDGRPPDRPAARSRPTALDELLAPLGGRRASGRSSSSPPTGTAAARTRCSSRRRTRSTSGSAATAGRPTRPRARRRRALRRARRSAGPRPRHARTTCCSPSRLATGAGRCPLTRGRGVEVVALDGIPEIVAGRRPRGDPRRRDRARRADVRRCATTTSWSSPRRSSRRPRARSSTSTTVEPRPEAVEFARAWDRDPRQVEVVLREARRVVRMASGVLITETPPRVRLRQRRHRRLERRARRAARS